MLVCCTDKKSKSILYYVLVAHLTELVDYPVMVTRCSLISLQKLVVPPVSGFIELVSIIYHEENLNTVIIIHLPLTIPSSFIIQANGCTCKLLLMAGPSAGYYPVP